MIKLKDILKEVQDKPQEPQKPITKFKKGDQVTYEKDKQNKKWTITVVQPGQPNLYFIKDPGGLVVPHVQEKELTLLTAS